VKRADWHTFQILKETIEASGFHEQKMPKRISQERGKQKW
jgi:hypothetical protein